MPENAGPERSLSKAALRTRVLMVGVFIGAILSMVAAYLFSFGFQTPEQRAKEAKEQAIEHRETTFKSPPGSCLMWSAPDASDVEKVPCTSDHLLEVVGVVDISDRYPPGARQPDAEAWRTLAEERCGDSAKSYLGKPLDPAGKLSVGVLRPDARQWANGERKLHCGLQWVGPGGGTQTLNKPVKQLNQSNVWDPGTCLALVDKAVGDPVECSEQHSYEIIGVVDLRKNFDEFPPKPEQQAWLDKQCNKIAVHYTGHANLSKQGLILTWDTREPPSWRAGSTLVNCKVGAVLKDNSGLAPVRGSVRKDDKPSTTPNKDGDGSRGDKKKDGRKPPQPAEGKPDGG